MRDCKHCSGEIANDAATCPHCGGKNPTAAGTATTVFRMVLGGVLCLGMYSCITGFADQEKQMLEQAETRRAEQKEEAKQNYQKVLEQVKSEVEAQKAIEEAAAKAAAEKLAKEEAAKKAKQDQVNANAVEFLKKRVDQGSISAAYKLGIRYLEGDGVETNKAEAIRLLTLAANQGDKKAKEKLEEVSK